MLAIFINALVVLLEIWALVVGISINGVPDNFMYYTQCSNLLGAVAWISCLWSPGLFTCAVNTGILPDSELEAEHADKVFPNMAALLAYLTAILAV